MLRRSPLIVILIASALRLYRLDYQPLWADEMDSLAFAAQPLGTLLSKIYAPGWNGPLFHLLLHFWIQLAGTGGFSLRFFSVIFGVLAVAAAYPLGSCLTGKRSGTLLSLLLGISPYLVWYSQEAKMYSLLLFLSMLSALLLIYASQTNRWVLWCLYVLVTWASWQTHILAVLLVPFHLAIWFTRPRNSSDHGWSWSWLLWLLGLGVLYIPLAKWEIPLWLSTFTTGHYSFSLLTLLRTQLFVLAAGYPSRLAPAAVLVSAFLTLCGLCFPHEDGQEWTGVRCDPSCTRKGVALLLLYFTMPMLGLYLVSLGMPIYTDRYLITVAPALYGLCAVGLVAARRRWPALSIGLLLILVLVNLLTIYIQANEITKPLAVLMNLARF